MGMSNYRSKCLWFFLLMYIIRSMFIKSLTITCAITKLPIIHGKLLNPMRSIDKASVRALHTVMSAITTYMTFQWYVSYLWTCVQSSLSITCLQVCRICMSGTWILDLSHDPIWAIWLAELSKFHQHHDRIYNISTISSTFIPDCIL